MTAAIYPTQHSNATTLYAITAAVIAELIIGGKISRGHMNMETQNSELQNILAAAKEDTEGFKNLRFKANEGKFYFGDDVVPLGTEFVVHCHLWEKEWLKFSQDGKTVVGGSRKRYRVARLERPADRNDLGDLDESKWRIADNGKRVDPWSFQYRLPLENLETGTVVVFVTPTVGGRIAVSELCAAYVKARGKGQSGQPVVALAVGKLPSKSHGEKDRPLFEIVSWDEATEIAEADLVPANPVQTKANTVKQHDDMDDSIPF